MAAFTPTPLAATRSGGAKTISLKFHATDTFGNTTDLSTIAAYPLR